MKLLNVAMVRNVDTALGQMPTHSVQNSKICAILYLCKLLNMLLNNIRKVDGLVLPRTYCLLLIELQ
jgi:hypothetical protein